MLLGFYLVSIIALPLALGTFLIFNGLPRSRRCPHCGGETIRLRSRGHALLSRLMSDALHLRWCSTCTWQGTVRLTAELAATEPSPWRPPAVPRPVTPRRPTRPGGVNIRCVQIDGDEWQVQVQCWAEGPNWRGRMIFVGPAGRAWCVYDPQLQGDSALEVLSVAQSLPDDALVGRIRRASRPS